jgi:hypothetical protein
VVGAKKEVWENQRTIVGKVWKIVCLAVIQKEGNLYNEPLHRQIWVVER